MIERMNSATADPNATNSPDAQSAVRWSDLLCRDLFKLATEADEILRTCKAQGDDEGRIEHRGQRDAYLHAIELMKRHNDPSSATRPAGRFDYNHDAMARLDAMKG